MNDLKIVWIIFLISSVELLAAQSVLQPAPTIDTSAYSHQAVKTYDFAKKSHGYWLYEPAQPAADSATVIIFIHGYGGYNPMIYGKWIKHLVRQGNIVIYPRYQKNLFFPRPPKFTKNVARAIRDALKELEKEGHPKAIIAPLCIVGHSYGGVIAGNLAITYEKHGVPEPKGILMCAPGSGPFKGGVLESYEKMAPDLKLLLVNHQRDGVVGHSFAKLVFGTAVTTPQRNLLHHYPDYYGSPPIGAVHNECYSLDEDFDTGVRNFTAKRALQIGRYDVVDYNGYWKLFDALLACVREGKACDTAFGNTPQQFSLGTWSDGKTIRPFEVHLPKEIEKAIPKNK